MTLWGELRKYPWIGLVAARSNLAYIADVVSRVLFLGVVLYIFLRLWHVTFSESHAATLGGLTLAQMLWYLVATESMTLSCPRIAPKVDEDVRTGSLAVQLVRPLSYPLYMLSAITGERLVRFIMNLSVGSVIAYCFVGPLAAQPAGLLVFACALPLAFVLDFLANFLIGLFAFWLEDTSGLLLMNSRLTMILGGMLIPVELFPEAAQPIIKALPFASIVYGPARLFVRPDATELLMLVGRQACAVAVYAVVVALVYRVALKRINANGG